MLLAQLESLDHFPDMHNSDQVEDGSHKCSKDTIKWYTGYADLKLPRYAMRRVVQEED
jgi:hypothetical protein